VRRGRAAIGESEHRTRAGAYIADAPKVSAILPILTCSVLDMAFLLRRTAILADFNVQARVALVFSDRCFYKAQFGGKELVCRFYFVHGSVGTFRWGFRD
jgi:hypothetical protein